MHHDFDGRYRPAEHRDTRSGISHPGPVGRRFASGIRDIRRQDGEIQLESGDIQGSEEELPAEGRDCLPELGCTSIRQPSRRPRLGVSSVSFRDYN